MGPNNHGLEPLKPRYQKKSLSLYVVFLGYFVTAKKPNAAVDCPGSIRALQCSAVAPECLLPVSQPFTGIR